MLTNTQIQSNTNLTGEAEVGSVRSRPHFAKWMINLDYVHYSECGGVSKTEPICVCLIAAWKRKKENVSQDIFPSEKAKAQSGRWRTNTFLCLVDLHHQQLLDKCQSKWKINDSLMLFSQSMIQPLTVYGTE